MALTAPAVSIVTATWNRSAVLRLTIEALLRSTFDDWEQIVVGDACTDDTEDVVRSFDHPRLRFVNRAENSGDQAVPNNEGVRLARGRFVAFLNHDDLWLREHLAVAVRALEESGADFVSTLTVTIDGEDRKALAGVCPSGRYDPMTWIPASSWVMRRELFDRVGPWRPAAELHAAPSQEWLLRVWRAGAAMIAIPQVTVVNVMSGGRRDSYARAEAPDSERYAAMLRDAPEETLRDLLLDVAWNRTAETIRPELAAPLLRFGKNAVRRIALACGIHPMALLNATRFGRRGGFVDSLRRTRGLPPLPRSSAGPK